MPALRPFALRAGTPRPAALLWLMAGLAVIPFALVALPSMTDLPGHIARYHVMLEIDRSAWLRTFYAFDWRLVGNLGADLLVRALAPLTGVEAAARIVAASVAPATLLGIAAVSRAAHGRVQPTAVVAGAFVLTNPLMFGFVNYCVALALALLVFAAWIAARERPARWCALLGAPLVFLVWLAHAMGWGVLALMVAGFEGERLWRRRAALLPAFADAAVRALAFAPPVLLTLSWRSGSGGALFGYGDHLLVRKAMNWVVILRADMRWLDVAEPAAIAGALAVLLWRGAVRIDWRLGAGAALLVAATFLMPTTLFGSWGADERVAPVATFAAVLALRWTGTPGLARRVMLGALALFAARTAVIAQDWRRLDARYASHLRALERVPQGARIAALVLVDGCHTPWPATAYAHLVGLAVARRDALVNNHWMLPGAAMLRVTYPLPPEQLHDPAQRVEAIGCDGRVDLGPLHRRLAGFVPGQWTHIWILRTGGVEPLWPGHRPLYRDNDSALFRAP